MKAIFLDRDGVLNIEIGDYIRSKENFTMNKGSLEFLKIAIEKGYKLIVITNQGGISKGLYTKEILQSIHEKMISLYHQEGIFFEEIFYCPHHSNIEKCLCRKPHGLMIEKALQKYKLNKNKCFMIGDTERDIKAAERAGIRGYLLTSNSSLSPLIPFLT